MRHTAQALLPRAASLLLGILAAAALMLSFGTRSASAATTVSGALPPVLTAAGSPYVAVTNISVSPGTTTVMEAGAVIKFMPATLLIMNGRLETHGTPENPAVFTSIYDDSVGGDTGGDGLTPVTAQNRWDYVRFTSGSSGDLEGAHFRYGGRVYTSEPGACVHIAGGDVDALRSRFSDCRSYGVLVSSGSFDAGASSFEGSPYGLLVQAGASASAAGSLFRSSSSGGEYGAYSLGPVVDARGSWWGRPEGPLFQGQPQVRNAAYAGGSVDYSDWLSANPLDPKAASSVIVRAPDAVTELADAEFAFASDESPVSRYCSLDGGSDFPCEGEKVYIGVPVGSHSFRLTTVDAHDNVSQATHTWSVTAPQFSATAPAQFDNGAEWPLSAGIMTLAGSDVTLGGGPLRSLALRLRCPTAACAASLWKVTVQAGTHSASSQTSVIRQGATVGSASGYVTEFAFADGSIDLDAEKVASFTLACHSGCSGLATADMPRVMGSTADRMPGSAWSGASSGREAFFAFNGAQPTPPAPWQQLSAYEPLGKGFGGYRPFLRPSSVPFTAPWRINGVDLRLTCDNDDCRAATFVVGVGFRTGGMPGSAQSGPEPVAEGVVTSFTFAGQQVGCCDGYSHLEAVSVECITGCAALAWDEYPQYLGIPGTCGVTGLRADWVPSSNVETCEGTPWYRIYGTSDATAPATILLTAPPETSVSTSATLSFQSNDPGAAFECRHDAPGQPGQYAPCGLRGSGTADLDGLAAGQHSFLVRARDFAGNLGAVSSVSWNANPPDTTPPSIEIIDGPSGTTDQVTATLAFTSDDANATFLCAHDTPGSSGAWLPCTSPAEYGSVAEPLADGDHVFRVVALDFAGNESAEAVREWVVETVETVQISVLITDFQEISQNAGELKSPCYLQPAEKTYGSGEGIEYEDYVEDIEACLNDYFAEVSYGKIAFSLNLVMEDGVLKFTPPDPLTSYAGPASNRYVGVGRLLTEAAQHISQLGQSTQDFLIVACDCKPPGLKWDMPDEFRPVSHSGNQRGIILPLGMRFGAWAHEIGHQLGLLHTGEALPDLYQSGGYGDGQVGLWDLMALGTGDDAGKDPVHMSAYSKMFLGWIAPQIDQVPSLPSVTLTALPQARPPAVAALKYYTSSATDGSDSYYLVEARDLSDDVSRWDRELPRTALQGKKFAVVYHVSDAIGYRYVSIPGPNSVTDDSLINDGILDPSYGESYTDMDALVKFNASHPEVSENTTDSRVQVQVSNPSIVDMAGFILKHSHENGLLQQVRELAHDLVNPVGASEARSFDQGGLAEKEIAEAAKFAVGDYSLVDIVVFTQKVFLALLFVSILIWVSTLVKGRRGQLTERAARLQLHSRMAAIVSLLVTVFSYWFIATFGGLGVFDSSGVSRAIGSPNADMMLGSFEDAVIPDLDLHVFCDDGRHVGVNYASGAYEVQIDSTLTNGDNPGTTEWIFFPPSPENASCRHVVSARDNAAFLAANPDVASQIEDATDSYSLYVRSFGPGGEVLTSATLENVAIMPGEADAYAPADAAAPEAVPAGEADLLPPATEALASGPAGLDGWFTGPVTVTLSAADDSAGVARTEYSLDDGETWSAYVAPLEFTGDGEYPLRYRSVDRAGRAEETRELVVRIDSVAPDVAVSGGPSAVTSATVAEFGLESSDSEASFECALDTPATSGPWLPCGAEVAYDDLADGQYSFSARAVDPAGNASTSAQAVSWLVDTVAPEIAIVAPVDGLWTSQSSVDASVAASDGGSVVVSVAVNGTPCTLAGSAWHCGAVPLVGGENVLAAEAVDEAGNAATVRIRVNVDTAAPDTFLDAAPSALTSVPYATFAFSSDESSVVFRCSLDEAAFTPCTSPLTLDGLAEGPHSLEAYAVDAAGNADPGPSRHEWLVDTVAPVIVIGDAPAGAAQGDTFAAQFSASDDGSGLADIDADLNGSAVHSGEVVTLSAAGAWVLHVTAADRAGNVTVRETSFDVLGRLRIGASSDTFVRQAQPNQPQGAGPTLRVSAAGDYRTLVRFDLSPLPTGASVVTARLSLDAESNAEHWGAEGGALSAHRLASDWSETAATWNCALDAIPGNQRADCSGTAAWEMRGPAQQWLRPWVQAASAQARVTDDTHGVVDFDVTADFAPGTVRPAFGWIVLKDDENRPGAVTFGSRESARGPTLEVLYRLP